MLEVEEEYTDYSCSTALERLSRDVETILRAWHVDQGCDRHVSLASNTTNSFSKNDEDAPTCPLIRSQTIAWNIPVTTERFGRTSVTIDLELALWDDPTERIERGLAVDWYDDYDYDYGNTHNHKLMVESSTVGQAAAAAALQSMNGDQDNSSTPSLVKSLQRSPFGSMPAHDYFFDNLAHLFGIGQHLSLSPIQPQLPLELHEWLTTNIVERHDTSSTAKFALGSTLSGWLQSSLNCAISNCHCAIPAFGIWGIYRPNELISDRNIMIHGGGGGTATTTAKHHNSTTTGTSATLHTPTQASSSHWSLQSPTNDHFLGTTIQTKHGNSNGNGNGAVLSPPPPPSPPKGLSVFPKWAQPLLQHTEIPQVSKSYQRRAQQSFWNAHYVPPLICGHVTGHTTSTSTSMNTSTSSSSDTTAATMWVSATSYLPKGHVNHNDDHDTEDMYNANGELHHALASSSRLAIWGSVLLQHCPKSSSSQVCVLNGARHVFGWFKPPSSDNQMNGIKNSLGSALGLFGNTTAASSITTNTYTNTNDPLLLDWRLMNIALISTPKPDDTEFHLYRKHCQAYAMDLLEEAWNTTATTSSITTTTTTTATSSHSTGMEYYDYASHHHAQHRAPVWGPMDDPVASFYATTTWSGKVTQGGKVAEPLLTFPLRIRSNNPVKKRDWIDMEESVEKTILDPLHPTRFVVQVYYDRDASVNTLAANQRCILASLIRSATLPGETLLHHLTDVSLIEQWDDDAGTVVACKLAEKAKCGTATQHIVQALDWTSNINEHMITLSEAEAIVHAVLQDDVASGYPTSPEEQFLSQDDICRPFRRGAPFGRLVSLLFAQLAKLRSLSSMSLVWNVFCQELRRRWQARESLPNMQYIAGLDPHPLQLYQQRCFSSIGHQANFAAFLNGSEPDPDDYHCLIGQKLQVFQIGVECIVSSELLEHETMERFLEQGQVPATAKVGKKDATPGLVPTTVGEEEDDEDEYDVDNNNNHHHDVPKWRPVGSDKLPSEIRAPTEDPPHPSKIVLTNASSVGGKKRKWPKAKSNSMDVDAAAPKADYGPPTINSDLEFWVMDEPGYAPRDAEGMDFAHHQTDDTGFDFVMPAPPDMENLDADDSVEDYRRSRRSSMVAGGATTDVTDLRGWEGTIMQEGNENDDDDEDDDSEGSGDSAASRTTAGSLSQAYFDAAEAGSIFSTKHGFVTLDTVVNVADMKRRPGARCPVHKVTLRTGDQLYAPYLQRPAPLTDDLVMERKHMLTNDQREGESRKAVLQARLDLAHRLQRPKLLSDMSAFKAANPNATIDDFTRWYGNPGSPLDDYDDVPLPDDMSLADAYYDSAAKKLDRASEAMKVLMATREFWASTWEKAPSVPAAEQHPLFDFETTVEMALDYLEQMHPANLVNQVMAVNLSSAYFALVSSAEDAMNVPLMKKTILNLRAKLDHALQLLSDDATGALFQFASSDNASTSTATANQYISEESIYACEQACNGLSVTETMLARAVSLLSKFPSQYLLVQDLLRLTDGTTVAMTDSLGRKGCLDAIYQQQRQQRQADLTDRLPKPVMREYVLRNLDDDKPCQLAVRFGDAGAYLGRVENEGGVVLAILKSYTD